MDDAALVEAARGGDGSAWGAIYDRYADKLHDHCHRILRDRDEAADALHDAFIAAAGHLDQLRDPTRLRPWLYSICRHEALRRARQSRRVELSDEVGEMTGVEVDMDQSARAAELQELVWSAAAGLNQRDRALLDLNLRQGLEGQDLADAMGTSLNNSYVMLSRLRDQVERSLGALLIARLGRADCEELDALLADWDGKFSPLLRKRVARHVDGCDICRERRAAVVSPLALLAVGPIVPAPADLRRRVLDGIGADIDPQPISFTRDGFAAPERSTVPPRKVWWLVAAVMLLAGVVGTVLAVNGGDEPTQLASAGGSTTTAEPTSTTTEAPTTTSTTLETTTTTTVPEVAPPVVEPEGPTSTEEPVVVPPPDTTPPVITSVTSQHPEIWAGTSAACQSFEMQTTITATVTGASAVTLRWADPALTGSKNMTASGPTWTATLGPFTVRASDLMLDYTVEARDPAGNRSMWPATIMVAGC